MIDKKSSDYMRSEFSKELYGSDKHTTYEKEIKVEGNNIGQIKTVLKELKER